MYVPVSSLTSLQYCDTINNIDKVVFENMARAAAYTVDVSFLWKHQS